MLQYIEKNFIRLYWSLCGIVFILILLRAYFIPFSHDEAATFFFYVQNDNYMPYEAHAYTNNHFLNSFLSTQFYHLFGSHRFILRLPNTLSFWVLCWGVFQFFKSIPQLASKIVLICFFILTFNFLDFFELSRGYGISLAFIVAGLSCLNNYFLDKKTISFFLFAFSWHIALAANLTLIVPLVLLHVFIIIFQINQKVFFTFTNFIILSTSLYLLKVWMDVAFYYNEKGLLDSGGGDDYWEITFVSLINCIYGTNYLWLQIVVVALFFLVLLFSISLIIGKAFSVSNFYKTNVFYVAFLTVLIVAYYLQKKILHINYPEDRTGLFIYVFFGLCITFFTTLIKLRLAQLFAFIFFAFSIVHFVMIFNLKNFTFYFYKVVSNEMYAMLAQEFENDKQLFTIGGHRIREMNFAFLNYSENGLLNPMDDNEQMHMNCDYYIALAVEKPYYSQFYEEIGYDEFTNRVLLKRKQKINRMELPNFIGGIKNYNGANEYFEFLRFSDTAITTRNCIEVDIELYFSKVPKPFNGFLVLQMNDENSKQVCYKRVPLNWIADNLNGSMRRFKLTTGPLPKKFKDCVIYLWNINKKECNFELNKLKIMKLDAVGINLVIPQSYYDIAKQTITYELL